MLYKRLQEIFIEVIRIDGLSGNEKDMADYIREFLKKYDYNPREDDSNSKTNSNSGNIICKIGDGGNFVLSCHMDTARPTKDVNPLFESDKIITDGKTVLGVDNRVGVSILLYLAEKIFKEKIKTKNFTLVFTTCEETTLGGSRHIALNGKIQMGFVFDSYLRPGKFINSSFGAASFEINVLGKESHSGISPDKGVNALQIASDAITKLKLGNFNSDTTLNIGLIKGGSAVNVVPGIVTLEGEIRSVTMNAVDECSRIVESVFNKSAKKFDGKIEFTSRWDFKPYKIEKDSMVYKMITESIKKAELIPEPAISRGGSDANSYNERGIASVNIGIGAQNPHSNDEFILKEDFQNAFNIALELVRET